MTDGIHPPDALRAFERIYLEKLRLAAEIILGLGPDEVIAATFETELVLFKDRVEVALMLPETAPGVLSRRGPVPPDPGANEDPMIDGAAPY